MNQEIVIKMQIMQQETQQLNEQLQLIEQHLNEMQELDESLNEIDKTDEKNNEILTNLGKKIYLPVQIKSKNLIVEIGRGNFVKKSISETKEIIQEQKKKLITAKSEIFERLESIQPEIESLMIKFQEDQVKEKSKKNK